ncbi:MAG: PEP-CTERM sorting domain-containing protein [Nitrosomonas sp.]|nr:PEP-CTERM sorting domain-containing protein [Nitrosomonas sp.]
MPQSHVRSTTFAVQASLIAAVALFGVNAAEAANAVVPKVWSGNDYLDIGSTTITGAGAGISNNGFTTNGGLLNNSAWAHAGHWYNFENKLDGADVSVTVTGTGALVPGLAVWATGASVFDGGTEGFAGETSTAGFGTPHSFNVSGAMGDAGTLWMASGFGGNVIENLGYAVANPSVNFTTGTGWGETIQAGVHDVSLTNIFESGVSGNTGAQMATLAFNDLASGWYTVYIGGTDSTTASGGYDLVVSAVPEAETWAMLLAGLGLIGWRLRNQKREESGMMPA